MRRIMVLVTLVVLMTAVLVMSAGIGQALTLTPATITIVRTPSGVPVDPAACEVLAESSAMFKWRVGGEVCWVDSPISTNDFQVVSGP